MRTALKIYNPTQELERNNSKSRTKNNKSIYKKLKKLAKYFLKFIIYNLCFILCIALIFMIGDHLYKTDFYTRLATSFIQSLLFIFIILYVKYHLTNYYINKKEKENLEYNYYNNKDEY